MTRGDKIYRWVHSTISVRFKRILKVDAVFLLSNMRDVLEVSPVSIFLLYVLAVVSFTYVTRLPGISSLGMKLERYGSPQLDWTCAYGSESGGAALRNAMNAKGQEEQLRNNK